MVQFSILSGIKSDTGTPRTSLSDEEKKKIEADILKATSVNKPTIVPEIVTAVPKSTVPKTPEVMKFEQNLKNENIIQGLKQQNETISAKPPAEISAAKGQPYTPTVPSYQNRLISEDAQSWIRENVPIAGPLLFGSREGNKTDLQGLLEQRGIVGTLFPSMMTKIADEIEKKTQILIDAGTDKKRAVDISGRWVTGRPQIDINPTERDLLRTEDQKQNALKGLEALQLVEPFTKIPSGNVVEQVVKNSRGLQTMPEIRSTIAQRFPELANSRELDQMAEIVAKGGTPTQIQEALKPIVENAKINGPTMAAAPETKALAVTVDQNGIPKVVESVRSELAKVSPESEAQLTNDALSGKREYYRLSNPDISAPEVRAGTVPRVLSPTQELNVFKIGNDVSVGDHVFLSRAQAEAMAKQGEAITQAVAKVEDLVRADSGKFILAPESALSGPKLPPLNLEEQAAIRAEQQAAEARTRVAAREAERNRVAVEREARAFEKKMAQESKAAEKQAVQQAAQREKAIKLKETTANRIIREAKSALVRDRIEARAASAEHIQLIRDTYKVGFPKEALSQGIKAERIRLVEELNQLTEDFKKTVSEQRTVLKEAAADRKSLVARPVSPKTARPAGEVPQVTQTPIQTENTAGKTVQEATAHPNGEVEGIPGTQKKSVTVPVNEKGVIAKGSEMTSGEGEQLQSRLSSRMSDKFKALEATAEDIKDGVDKTGKGLIDETIATYNKMNVEGALKKAAEIVVRDPQAAIEAVKAGQMIDGIHPEALYVALTEYAPMSKDMKFITDVTSLRATSAGQRLRLLAEIDKENPVRVLQTIEDIRLKKAIARGEDIAGTTKEVVKKGAEELATTEVKLNRAQELINSLICPE